MASVTAPGFPLRAVVAELRDERHRLDALETGDPVSGVRAVLSWSYESLTEPAARLSRLLEPARQQISLPPAAVGIVAADVSSHAQALAWLEAEHQALLGAVARAAAAGLTGMPGRSPGRWSAPSSAGAGGMTWR